MIDKVHYALLLPILKPKLLRFVTQEVSGIGLKEIAEHELCVPGCEISGDEGECGNTLCAAANFFSGGLSKFRIAALRIALLVISSSAVEIPSADRILVCILRRSPSLDFKGDNKFSFVPEGDCNPDPLLIVSGALLEADGRGVNGPDINRSPTSVGLRLTYGICLHMGSNASAQPLNVILIMI